MLYLTTATDGCLYKNTSILVENSVIRGVKLGVRPTSVAPMRLRESRGPVLSCADLYQWRVASSINAEVRCLHPPLIVPPLTGEYELPGSHRAHSTGRCGSAMGDRSISTWITTTPSSYLHTSQTCSATRTGRDRTSSCLLRRRRMSSQGKRRGRCSTLLPGSNICTSWSKTHQPLRSVPFPPKLWLWSCCRKFCTMTAALA